ncbi:hypothetical protein D3C73_1244980 [compost metagenome]
MSGEQVHALDDCSLGPLRQIGLRVVFVHQRDVVELVDLPFEHLAHAVVEDHRKLPGERRIVGPAIGHHRRHQMAVAVLMLQAFAPQGGASRRGPEQETPGALVGRRPDQVTDALEAEHRVVDVERQHRQVVHAVGGGRGDP